MSVNDHVIHMENGILHADSPRSKIDSMISKAIAQQPAGPLVVHFHGGLVNYKSGMDVATKLLDTYGKAGGFPVFFVWESGLIETIKNNLGEVSKEKIFQIIWKRVRKIIARKLTQVEDGRDIGDLPQPADNRFEIEIDEALDSGDVTELMKSELEGKERLTELSVEERSLLEAELGYDFDLANEVEKISNALRDPEEVESELNSRSFTVLGSTSTLMDPVALNQIAERPDPTSRGLISMAKMIKAVVIIAAKVISRFVQDRDHGLHATIVEEILHYLYIGNVGGLIWKTMKKDTADSFGPDSQAHGGTAFLHSLKHNADSGNPPRIVLIGHSTGAVYISEFLKHADSVLPANFKFDVIYLAPASTFRLTAGTVDKYKHRIANLRMFTMTDAWEKKDQLVKMIYPHSLLYFVSGVVESEVDMSIVGMERFYDSHKFSPSKFPAVATVRDFFGTVTNSMVWSVVTGNTTGLNSECKSHGDFDDEIITMESVSHIIAKGY